MDTDTQQAVEQQETATEEKKAETSTEENKAPEQDEEKKPETNDEIEVSEEEEPEKPTMKGWKQSDAWDRMKKQREDYRSRAEFAENMLRQMQIQAPQQQQQIQQPTQDKPARDQFETDAEYVDALTDWKLEQRLNGLEQKITATQQQNQIIESWNRKLAAAREEYGEDFDHALADAMDIPIGHDRISSQEIAMAIMSSDRGADINYYLATNKDEARRILNLPTSAAIRELGKVEAYIEAEKRAEKKPSSSVKRVSSAPAPIQGPKASSGGGRKNPDQMSPSEWRTYMNRKEQERRQKR